MGEKRGKGVDVASFELLARRELGKGIISSPILDSQGHFLRSQVLMKKAGDA